MRQPALPAAESAPTAAALNWLLNHPVAERVPAAFRHSEFQSVNALARGVFRIGLGFYLFSPFFCAVSSIFSDRPGRVARPE